LARLGKGPHTPEAATWPQEPCRSTERPGKQLVTPVPAKEAIKYPAGIGKHP